MIADVQLLGERLAVLEDAAPLAGCVLALLAGRTRRGSPTRRLPFLFLLPRPLLAPCLRHRGCCLQLTMEQMDCFWGSARRLAKFDGGISFLGIFAPFTERDVTGFLEKDPKILIFLSDTCLFRTCDVS